MDNERAAARKASGGIATEQGRKAKQKRKRDEENDAYGGLRRVCHRRSTGCLSCASIFACSRSTITLILQYDQTHTITHTQNGTTKRQEGGQSSAAMSMADSAA